MEFRPHGVGKLITALAFYVHRHRLIPRLNRICLKSNFEPDDQMAMSGQLPLSINNYWQTADLHDDNCIKLQNSANMAEKLHYSTSIFRVVRGDRTDSLISH